MWADTPGEINVMTWIRDVVFIPMIPGLGQQRIARDHVRGTECAHRGHGAQRLIGIYFSSSSYRYLKILDTQSYIKQNSFNEQVSIQES